MPWTKSEGVGSLGEERVGEPEAAGGMLRQRRRAREIDVRGEIADTCSLTPSHNTNLRQRIWP